MTAPTAEVVELAAALVAIDSVNPSLVPGAAGEGAAAAFVEDWARRAGLEQERLEATPGRPSVLVRARGRGGGRTLLLCGHLDTVGVEGMHDPHAPRIHGDRLHGRGAYDMKAGLAAALIACRDAARSGLAGDVAVAAVADEEHASLGVQEAVAALAAAAGAPAGGVDGAIVTEPTELALVVAHKGFAWQEVTVTGRAAHGSRPDLGVDAILESAPILAGLSALDAALAERPHPLLGRGSLHASLIEGGRELSTYPDRCVLTLERRTLPGESTADVERELDELLTRCRSADPQLEATARTLLVREPFAVDPGARIVRAVGDAAAAVRGSVPEQHGAPFWTDAAFIAAAGIPTVLFGPAGAGAHATEEWVAVDSLLQTTEVLRRTAAAFCA